MSGLTLKHDVIYTDTRNGKNLIVEMLVCGHCQGQTFKLYYPRGVNHCHLYCTRCRVSFINLQEGGNDDQRTRQS